MEEMKDYMAQIDASMKRIQPGDLLEAKVVSVLEEEVLVNIGFICDGIIPRGDFTKDRKTPLTEYCKPDDVINVMVVEVRESEGQVILSASKAAHQVAWRDFDESLENGKNLLVEISEAVKGGVTAVYMGVRGFIPASRIGVRNAGDLTNLIGHTLPVRVIELEQSKHRVVFSAKEIADAARAKQKDKLMATLSEGDKLSGTVTKLMDFGAFVDLGGVEGLIHVSDLSWHRVKHPSELLKVGDSVEVVVQKIDPLKNRISLSLKTVQDDPWIGVGNYYQPGDLVEGTVVRLTPFGAFVEIEDGVEGLVHISEISEERVTRLSDVLKEGQKVEVMILKVNEAERRISLSIRQAKEEEGMNYEYEEPEEETTATLGDLFGDQLNKLK